MQPAATGHRTLGDPIPTDRLAPIKGTTPVHSAAHVPAGPFRAGRRPLEIRLVLHRDPPTKRSLLGRKLTRFVSEPPLRRPKLSDAEFERIQSPNPEHARLLSAYAESAGLRVVERSNARHDMIVAGSAAQIAAAFGVEFEMRAGLRGSFRTHQGEIHLPRRLHGLIEGVLGLDQVPLHRPQATLHGVAPHRFSPLELAEFYRFPAAAIGRGQRIAVLSFGGGYDPADFENYFGRVLRIRPPRITARTIGTAANSPMPRDRLARIFTAYNTPGITLARLNRRFGPAAIEWAKETLETTMDVEIAGAIANGAAIDVIFAPPDAAGFYDAIYTALGMGPVRCPPADVISISWGSSEQVWASHLEAINAAVRAAALRSATVIASSGDYGSVNDPLARRPHANFPASSPHALACGGTSLTVDPARRPIGEVAWSSRIMGQSYATGGGVSGRWYRPEYQRGVKLPHTGKPLPRVWDDPERLHQRDYRGLPDVSANADFNGGYRVFLGGVETTGAGTSAATPLWAGLVARLNESLGRPVGWLNPIIYQPAFRKTFRDIVKGDNIVDGSGVAYRAAKGWDPCTGIGSPNGEALLAALAGAKRSRKPARRAQSRRRAARER